MRVALVHNHYQQRGGEDQVFAAEGELLEAHGHQVTRYTAHNDQVSALGRLALARTTVWNAAAARELEALLRRERVQVAHFHNTLPLISPAGYYAARAAGAAVVQTLHNYRLLCPAATFYRDGHVCVECSGRAVPWPAVAHGCYRGSRAASAVVGGMVAAHRLLGTWSRAVDVYVTPTAFTRDRYVADGFPAERVVVKPNFLPADPGVGAHDGGYALYVGRLAPEKGVATLLEGWRQVGARLPLKVVGSGPLEPLLAAPPPGVEWLGQQSRERVLALMRDATVLVFPSEWFETFGLGIVEAFATGLPVVASRLGVIPELVRDGETGWLFAPGDAADLAAKVALALADAERTRAIGRRGREEFEARYGAERNHALLMAVYEAALARAARR